MGIPISFEDFAFFAQSLRARRRKVSAKECRPKSALHGVAPKHRTILDLEDLSTDQQDSLRRAR